MTRSDDPSIRTFYDRWYKARSKKETIDRLCRIRVIRNFLRALSLGESNILELGCGQGWLANVLSQYGPVTAVDLSVEAILAAKSAYPHIEFRAGSCFEMTDLPRDCDLIVSSEVIEHMVAKEQIRFLALISDHLRPGGSVILTTPNREVAGKFLEAGDPDVPDHLQPIEQWLSIEELRAMLEPMFEILKMKTALFFHPFLRRHRTLNWLRYVVYCRLGLLPVIEGSLDGGPGGMYMCCLARKAAHQGHGG